MDLSHLLRPTEKVAAVSDVGSGVAGGERDTLFKRKGLNFTATTSEGRILRSSQVGFLVVIIRIPVPSYSDD